MATRPVACEQNEGLALYIYWKREELMQKPSFSDNLDATFTTAYRNVCDHKAPICTLKEAAKVRGIGAWMLKQLKDFFADGLEHASQEDVSQSKKRKTTRRYLPQKNSAPYALLITLYGGFLNEGKSYMMKQELIDAAELSGLSKMQIQPSNKNSTGSGRFGDSTKDWYSGWSSMKTLISKGLVVKSSCPAKYMLTEEGHETAKECCLRGGLLDASTTSNQTSSQAQPTNASPSADQNSSQNQSSSPVCTVNRNPGPTYAAVAAAAKAPTIMRCERQIKSNETRLHGADQATPVTGTGASIGSTKSCLAVPPLSEGESFANVYSVILILDDRECFTRGGRGTSKSMFAERLRQQYKVDVEVRHLPVGDATWVAYNKLTRQEFVLDFIVERKAVDDLWSSIKDTRYKTQKLRLLRCGITRLIYLIEGDPNLIDGAESIKTAALTTEILEGFDVQRTRDTHDTISRYGELTNAINRRYSGETGGLSGESKRCMSYQEFLEHCSDVEKERVRDVFGVQLMQIRHVTEDIALSILDRYPTVLALAQAYTALEGDVSKQKNLLTGLGILNKNKSISSVVSRNVYNFFWAP
ncbi:crossover junction endonuclease MUS81 [Selaginella moellendorffii]|uniref:crossover junction endonuclease MUS81 n=1 Tax=Selaginella moellendorffii TaxID=88036 RepID=UPI000D1C63E4|nr:crossover junction endonuclease MUS81 [Selaginella moellendorffii]|eukprot:XP_024517250.1 crossover junction endonuclease MUS81 [Selaginella moellendorffii]